MNSSSHIALAAFGFIAEEKQEIKKIDVKITKRNEEKRLVYGVVLEPGIEDAQGDTISTEEIMKTMHDYMENSRAIGNQHESIVDSVPVEIYAAPIDFKMGDETIKKGAWVQVTKIKSDEIWKGVKSGKITGYSIGGQGERWPIN